MRKFKGDSKIKLEIKKLNLKCSEIGCKNKAVGFIKAKPLCMEHYKILKVKGR